MAYECTSSLLVLTLCLLAGNALECFECFYNDYNLFANPGMTLAKQEELLILYNTSVGANPECVKDGLASTYYVYTWNHSDWWCYSDIYAAGREVDFFDTGLRANMTGATRGSVWNETIENDTCFGDICLCHTDYCNGLITYNNFSFYDKLFGEGAADTGISLLPWGIGYLLFIAIFQVSFLNILK